MPANNNERLAADAAQMLADMQKAFGAMADVRKRREALTASAGMERGRITVVVDASGVIVETRYSDDIDDLSYGEIARATVQAAQRAAAEASAETEELMAPLRALRARVPGLLGMVPGLPDLREEMPSPRKASLLSPAMRENETVGLEFEDAVEYELGPHSIGER